MAKKISLLYPDPDAGFRTLSEETIHNLGFDAIVNGLSKVDSERAFIMRVISKMTPDPHTAEYRAEIFEDILEFPEIRVKMMKILEKIDFMRSYGTFRREYEEAASAFELIHRLEEIHDYIICVEAIHDCLSTVKICSEGLLSLLGYVDGIYEDGAFAEMKKDIDALRASTSELKSVTLGINLNERFEAESLGVISLNNKKFSKSGVIRNFSDAISARGDNVKEGNEWDGSFTYHPVDPKLTGDPKLFTIAAIPFGDSTVDVTRYMDRIVNHMLFLLVRKLKNVLNQYYGITITNITDLIPEFMYYIRWAEFIETMQEEGWVFRRAKVNEKDLGKTSACAVYNLLLAMSGTIDAPSHIVRNDLSFDHDSSLYILTGANRGGKTTFTVAIGQLFVLAQGGIRIPGGIFEYTPVDCIFTHFPADEDKTMDLGRLGEECKRFRELYEKATDKSLILLNETFSTTSFEEGFYIARDAVRAMLKKGVRTIYNTHMHKLARDIEDINASVGDPDAHKAQSLIVCSDSGNRSFRVMVAPPEGLSYAADIARKYGVTYEMLTESDGSCKETSE